MEENFKETRLEKIITELIDISQKRERELKEMDRIAKMLIRRDLELTETREKRERELKELDRIAKMLIRRDLELSELREKRERELQELRKKTIELENSRRALINILEDVDEAKKIAEEERDKIKTIITNLTDGLLVFDSKSRLSLINPRAEDFFEVKTKDIIGKSISELNNFPLFKPLIKLLKIESKGVFREDLPLKENLILETSIVPIMKGKERLGTLVILHDVTREKTVERMKTEFVSVAAHQLRTPLSAIKWTLKMLLDRDLGAITEEQKDFIEKTYQSNERMITLINALLDVTRIEEGRFLYKPILVDFELIMESMVNSYKDEAIKRKLKLEFQRLEEKLPRVLVDVEKIKLAIQNLLENAIRYTEPGGRVNISLKFDKNENKLEVAIKDTGVGIPKDQQERVFTKFFRATNVLKKETEGTGLGLFITKNIIEAHGGKIWFESEENKGTTFYFSLPVEKNLEDF